MIKNNTEFIFNDTPTKSNPIMNQKWVKRIDDYSNYAKEYIIHYKKSLKGNSISLSKYPYMKVKWEALGMKLEKAKKRGLLTGEQIKKVMKIQIKIVNTCCE
ncbi:hypothetical protein ACM55F_11815 [Flavobacterium sp. XS2P12]|uniref:hypothetical protein n=1 Tax=Flavobacterium melibiosi TaxID=3398734 RepID=UPI003A89E4F9